MRATCLENYGGIDRLVQRDLPSPEPKNGQIRARVSAAALGPADYKVAKGLNKFLHGRNFPIVLGAEFSGVVDSVGPGASRWKIGDQVFGFLPYGPGNNQGAFAEFLIAQADQIAGKPPSVSHSQAAAAATSALTSLQSFRHRGKLPPANANVLITGVSGAVDSTAILVARKLGARVTALGSRSGLELAKRFGAAATIDRKEQGIVERARGPFDVVFDPAAAYRWSQWRSELKDAAHLSRRCHPFHSWLTN